MSQRLDEADPRTFEASFADFIGTKHAIATSSGTSALHLSLIALGIKPRDEVIVPALTFFATVEAVLHQGATPVFADLDPNTYCIDPNDIENKITEKTRAIIPVHFFGQAAEMDHICEIRQKKAIKIIEDCAQAHGAEYKGKKVGSFGDANCWSFYATKNMTTGEGGMVTTDNEEVENKIRAIRNHGMVNRNDHLYLGYNYRMSEIHAAIGIVQLKKLESLNNKRIENSNKLRKELESLDWLEAQYIPDYVKHAFFWCAFKIAATGKHKPDVLLLDVRLPDGDGLTTLPQIRKHSPKTAVVMLSTFDNPIYIARAVALGASDYLLKGCSRREMISVIKAAADYDSPSKAGQMASIKATIENQRKIETLTNRQSQVVRYIALGLNNKEIGQALDIGYETVKEHVQNLLRKLDYRDRTQVAMWAMKKGIMS